MRKPDSPSDDPQRLQALKEYQVLDTPPEQSLDDLTLLAAHICEAPISLITLIDETRQWFKSKVGVEIDETPREVSFCKHAIEQEGLFIIPDATKDERFSSNPLVTGDPQIRFYAGTPLVTPSGHALGTLCVVDRVPRQLPPRHQEALRVLGRQVMAQLELRRQTREQASIKRALLESEERWQFALEGSDLGVWDWNPQTGDVFFSRRLCTMLGYEQHELGRSVDEWVSRVHPEDLDRTMEEVRAHFDGRTELYVSEHRLRTKSGSYLWVLDRGKVMARDAEGRPVRMVGTHTDITGRRLMEQGLRDSEAKLSRAQKVARLGIWEHSFDDDRLNWSEETHRIFGIPPGQFTGTLAAFNAMVHPEDLPHMLDMQRASEEQRGRPSGDGRIEIEHRIVRPDRSVRWVSELGQLERDADGRPVRLTGTVVDITERKQAEMQLREALSEAQRFRDALDNVPSFIYMKDAQGRYLYANKPTLRLFNCSVEELRGADDFRFFPAETAKRLQEIDRRVLRGQRTAEEIDVSGPGTGRRVYWEIKTPIYARPTDRQPCGLMGISTEITTRKQTEESLQRRETEYRELIGNLPAGIVVHGPDTAIILSNPMASRLLGLTEDQLRGKTVIDPAWCFVDEAGQPIPLSEYPVNRVLSTGRHLKGLVIGARRPDLDNTVWAYCNAYPVFDNKERIRQIVVTFIDITERRRAEDAIHESGRLAQSTIDALSAQICVLDEHGSILATNDAWQRFGGTPPSSEVPTRPDENYLEVCDRAVGAEAPHAAAFAAGIRSVIRGERASFEMEYPCHAAGEKRWFVGRVTRFPDDGPLRVVVAHENVTERKLAELASSRLAAIVESSDDAIIGKNLDGIISSWNRGAEKVFGYQAEEMIGTSIMRLIPEDRQDEETMILGKLRAGESVEHFQTQRRTKDGRLIDVSITASPIRNKSGTIIGASKVARDISVEKANEREIARLSRLYAALSQINQAIVFSKDRDQLFAKVSRALVEFGGFRMAWIGSVDDATKQILPSGHWGDDSGYLSRLNLYADDRPEGQGPTGTAIRENRNYICNDFFADPRTLKWREAAAKARFKASASFPIRADGRPVGAITVYSDEIGFFQAEEIALLEEAADDLAFGIANLAREEARQKAEAALRESEERLRQLAENIQEVFWMTDDSLTRTLYISPAYERVWGRSCASLYASPKTWLESVHPDDRERVRLAVETKQVQGTYDETYRIRRADGTERWIRDRAFPIRNDRGVIIRMVGTATDITEQRQLEEQFRQSQKMEAIGHLAGGVAHDFNNILAAMMMQADLAALPENLPAETKEFLGDIKQSAERAAKLTRQLLAFSRRQIMQRRELDLNETVTGLSRMLQRTVGADVRLQLNLHPTPLVTNADPGMLDQVLLNLVVNARDAMPDGGRLVVDTSEQTVTPDEAARLRDTAPGRYVRLGVTDTGSGIAPENMARIFEPFFTTKELGKGTGLGLATVFGIVKQHGGSISVQSKVGEGTSFHILLPAADPKDREHAQLAVQAKPRGGTETILLVEDEAPVRLLTRMVLERAGYTVLEAPDGPQALRLWRENKDAIRLLLTDIVMPEGLSGRDLAAGLQSENPALRVIFTTGYSAEIAGRDLQLKVGQNFIQKPATPNQLLETVRQSLDA